MATLWAVEGPHRSRSDVFVEFRCLSSAEGSCCHISKNTPTGLHLGCDDKVSRGRHAKVWVENGRFWLTDEGSTNGTYVVEKNALRKLDPDERWPLDNLSEFVVGDTVLVFHAEDLDQDELDRRRKERHAKGIRNAATLPRRATGTDGPTISD